MGVAEPSITPLDFLESHIRELRTQARAAAASGDAGRLAELRGELQRTERAWDALVAPPEPEARQVAMDSAAWSTGHAPAGGMLPARAMVHRVLTLLQAPAAAKLITQVHGAFFPGELTGGSLSSLRRDEERSYTAAPSTRPYYLCPALTFDQFAPARGLVTISTWPLERRIVGPLSTRADFLTCAVAVAEAVKALPGGTDSARPQARGLLARFAAEIPGAGLAAGGELEPDLVAAAAQAELQLHAEADRDQRREAAQRARRMDGRGQLFGLRPHQR